MCCAWCCCWGWLGLCITSVCFPWDYLHKGREDFIPWERWFLKLNDNLQFLASLIYDSNSLYACSSDIRTADEFSKIMAFFYYGAAKPPCLNGLGDSQEAVPSAPINGQVWKWSLMCIFLGLLKKYFWWGCSTYTFLDVPLYEELKMRCIVYI